jgi:hypothetical protein
MAFRDTFPASFRQAKIRSVDGDSELPLDAYLARLGLLLDMPTDGLRTVVATRATLERIEELLVREARRSGCSWTEIGDALGVSRQAAHARHVRSSSGRAGTVPGRRVAAETRP